MKKKAASLFCLLIGLILLMVGLFFLFNSYPLNETSQDKALKKTSTTQLKSSSSSETTNTSEQTSTTVDSEQSSFPYETIAQLDATYIQPISSNTSIYVKSLTDENQLYARDENKKMRAASVIKLFLLEEAYQKAAQGALDLEENYSLQASDIVGGTGNLQNVSAGTVLTYQEIIAAMIINSDNTASNIVITRLGGLDSVNQSLQASGYTSTNFGRYFLDTEALANGVDNYTSAKDLGELLTKLYHRQLVSESADQTMLDLLEQTTNHQKLSNDLKEMTHAYEKTGEYAEYGVQNDAMIMETNGNAYIVVVLSQDGAETQQLSQMSQLGSELSDVLFQ